MVRDRLRVKPYDPISVRYSPILADFTQTWGPATYTWGPASAGSAAIRLKADATIDFHAPIMRVIS
ncbi:MAG: hypothetical protein DMF98_14315 [Acidobacteria bacterium]|nr:MAG: hypothetical protein DMF98_14315 [Acidobacteriota bacterium]